MYNDTITSERVHHGKNVKRLREMLGIKQEAIAQELNITQQAMSKLEQKAELEEDVLQKIANFLHIPVDTIKNFNEKSAINIIANTFNDTFHENSAFIGYKSVVNPIDKIIELYERMLSLEREKNTLLEKMMQTCHSERSEAE